MVSSLRQGRRAAAPPSSGSFSLPAGLRLVPTSLGGNQTLSARLGSKICQVGKAGHFPSPDFATGSWQVTYPCPSLPICIMGMELQRHPQSLAHIPWTLRSTSSFPWPCRHFDRCKRPSIPTERIRPKVSWPKVCCSLQASEVRAIYPV